MRSFFILLVKHSQEFFTIQCSRSVTCFKCSFVYTESKTPSSLSLSYVSVMQHTSGFLHSLRSSHQVVYHYPVFQGCSMLPELLFLSGSNIPSSLSPSTFEFCEMYHVLLVRPKSSITVCHHPVFHVGDKVQILPHALWVIHTLRFITSCFSFVTCISRFLSILGQIHQ